MTPASLFRDRRGLAVTEFALVLPALVLLLLGIFGYGQYFLLAHTVQQIANNAARATISGLSKDEREAQATAAVARELALLPNAPANAYGVKVEDANGFTTVQIRLDAAGNELLKIGFVPMPSAVIVRKAVVRQGGTE